VLHDAVPASHSWGKKSQQHQVGLAGSKHHPQEFIFSQSESPEPHNLQRWPQAFCTGLCLLFVMGLPLPPLLLDLDHLGDPR
jgi:hypothetical protein